MFSDEFPTSLVDYSIQLALESGFTFGMLLGFSNEHTTAVHYFVIFPERQNPAYVRRSLDIRKYVTDSLFCGGSYRTLQLISEVACKADDD